MNAAWSRTATLAALGRTHEAAQVGRRFPTLATAPNASGG